LCCVIYDKNVLFSSNRRKTELQIILSDQSGLLSSKRQAGLGIDQSLARGIDLRTLAYGCGNNVLDCTGVCFGERGARLAVLDDLFAPLEIRIENELVQALTVGRGKVRGHVGQDVVRVLLCGEEHGIWSRVEGVRDLEWLGALIVVLHGSNDGATVLREVVDLHFLAAGVEVVRVGHGGARKEIKVLGLDGLAHRGKSLRQVLQTCLESLALFHGASHAVSAAHVLLLAVDDEHEHDELGPVRGIVKLNGATVAAVCCLTALLPFDKTAVHAAASTARTDARESGDITLQIVNLTQGKGETGETRRRRGETSSGGEVVLADNVQLVAAHVLVGVILLSSARKNKIER
jgi:hypothetical protein